MEGDSFFKISQLVVLLCFCSFFLHGQTAEKDSIADALKAKIREADSDSIRINAKLDLAGVMASYNIDTAVVVIKDVENEIKKINKNSAFYKKTKSTILKSFANAESLKENWANALEYQIQAVDYNIKIKDSVGLGIAYSGLSHIYIKLKDLTSAEKYIRKAINIQKYNGEPQDYSYSYLKLAQIFYFKKELDSAIIMLNKSKKIDTTKSRVLAVQSNIISIYKAQKKYKKAIKAHKELIKQSNPKQYFAMGLRYANLASTYGLLEDWENGLKAVDSGIYYFKSVGGRKESLMLSYKFKTDCLYNLEKFKEAYAAQALYKVYSDSVNNVEEQKRLTKLDLNYKFEKERELATLTLKNESAKKKLYFILLFMAILAASALIYVIRKNSKQRLFIAKNKLELKEMEKVKADLALSNRENELKKVVIENSITEEVLNKTLDDIKNIITYQNEKERQVALRALSADLLSEKYSQKSTSNIKTYIDQVHMDFKIHLDTNYPQLTPKDKELIYLMKAGLSNSQISKVLQTTFSAIRSNRYRLRKKLNLAPDKDIIVFLDQNNVSQ